MAYIENRSDAIAEIALSNSIVVYDFNIDFIPKSRPIIDFTGGTVDIKVEEGYVDIKAYPQKPIINVEPGKVEIFMKQYPSIRIENIGNKVDARV